jgi:hypothetical protein
VGRDVENDTKARKLDIENGNGNINTPLGNLSRSGIEILGDHNHAFGGLSTPDTYPSSFRILGGA